MALTFNTDVGSKILSNYLNKITKEIEKSTSRLTTGKKLSQDDPAGYIMVQNFKNQISSSEIGLKNVQLAQSELSYRESNLTAINASLQSALDALKGFSSATDDNTKKVLIDTANAAIGAVKQLEKAKFDGKELYPTTAQPMTINLGDGSNIEIKADVFKVSITAKDSSLTIASTDADINAVISTLESDIKANTGNISGLGAYNSILSSTADNITNRIEAYESTIDTISSVDVARETAKLTQNQILQQVTAALLSQQSSSAYLALSLITG